MSDKCPRCGSPDRAYRHILFAGKPEGVPCPHEWHEPAAVDKQQVSASEAQRRSFAYGNTAIENPRITREMVNEEADKLEQVSTGAFGHGLPRCPGCDSPDRTDRNAHSIPCTNAFHDLARDSAAPGDPLTRIKEKCEQYWNEPNICDAEIHAILEFIHREARAAEREKAVSITIVETG